MASPESAADKMMGMFPFAEMSRSMSTSMINQPIAIWSELLRFGARRLEAQAKLLQEVSTCKDMPEALERQTRFMNDAISAYTSEAALLADKAQEGLAVAKAA